MTQTVRPTEQGPGALLGQAMAFQPAKLILTGLDLGVFAALAAKPADAAELCDRLGLHQRGTGHFLKALVELGLLESVEGRYQLTDTTRRFLLADSTVPLGGFLGMASKVMYPAWDRLGETLRTGEPQAATFGGQDMFGELYDSDGKRDQLVRMAEDASRPLIPRLIEVFDWPAYRSVLELGGCRGNVLAGLVSAHPHLKATVFDLPQLETAFEARMAELGMTGRLGFHAGDFFANPLPAADVLMIGHSLIDWDDQQRANLIEQVFPAVNPGGCFLIWDPIIVPGEDSYFRNLIRSLNLQLMTPFGHGYELAECVGWLTDAGFASVEHFFLGDDVTLVVAHKA
ncbi:MAG TPA: methyltransferase [Pseudonocardiaceae bacterium]|jgi:hypothetical protein|nr:methyltransferase [Pseudonocardiaceae bacterium]